MSFNLPTHRSSQRGNSSPRSRMVASDLQRGAMLSYAVRAGNFVPDFDSTDVRRGSVLNSAREIDR